MSAEPKPTHANHPAIEAAFQAAPAILIAEIINGQLHLSPRPAPRHSRAAGEPHGELRVPFDLGTRGRDGWITLDEPEIPVGPRPDKLVPDLAGWRRARVTDEAFATAAVTVVPDWVCEISSDSTEVDDRGEKMPIYAREGVAWVSLVDPAARVLEVYRLEAGALRQAAVHRDEERVRAEPFDAIEIELGRLWRW